MAAIKPSLQSASPGAPIMNFSGGVVVATWTGLLDDSTPGLPVECANYILNSAQVLGTFGVAGEVQIEGSNDGTNFVQMPDINDDPAEATAAGILFFKESTVFVRPSVVAGDGDTLLTVIMSFRRQPNG